MQNALRTGTGQAADTDHHLEFDNFVSFDPSKARTKQAQKAIRSHAARSSAETRKATIAAKLRDHPEENEDEIRNAPDPKRARKAIVSNDHRRGSADSDTASSDTTPILPQTTSRSLRTPLSILGQGRVDPFRVLATSGEWHESFPRLIDTYLGSIAPSSQSLKGKTFGSDRGLLRNELWPDIMSNTSLLYANLMVAALQDCFGRGDAPNLAFVGWVRHMAIRNINESLSRNKTPDNGTIAAVAVLAAFELEFGDQNAFDTHMKGLQTMIRLRGGLYEGGLPTVVKNLVLSAGFDLPMFAGLTPYFRPMKLIGMEEFTDRKPGRLPAAFQKLQKMGLMQPTILVLISDLVSFEVESPHAKQTLQSFGERLASWTALKYLACEYCSIQSPLEDEINTYSHAMLRITLMCIVDSHWQTLPNKKPYDRPGFLIHLLELETKTLHPEVLIGTVYAELGWWSLFIICSRYMQMETRLWDTLRRLTHSLQIYSWSKASQIMSTFYRHLPELESQCLAIWKLLISNDTSAKEHKTGVSRYGTKVFPIRSREEDVAQTSSNIDEKTSNDRMR